MIDELLLLSGNDIPFPEAQLTIHQPTLKEIAFITEPVFHYGIRCLTFSKESLSAEDKKGLEDKQDFEIFMSMMNEKEFKKFNLDSLSVLTLLFPEYQIEVKSQAILLIKNNEKKMINYENFELFKNLLKEIFCLDKIENKQQDYNPADDRAKKIAEKLKKGKQKMAKLKGQNDINKITIYNNFLSALAIGNAIDLNTLIYYTVYQLNDQYNRYLKKVSYDIVMQAKMAGATGIEDVDNWMD